MRETPPNEGKIRKERKDAQMNNWRLAQLNVGTIKSEKTNTKSLSRKHNKSRTVAQSQEVESDLMATMSGTNNNVYSLGVSPKGETSQITEQKVKKSDEPR